MNKGILIFILAFLFTGLSNVDSFFPKNAYGQANCDSLPAPFVDLSECDLSGKDFTGVDLTSANLYHTNFNRANLSGADLTGANLDYASFAGADLSNAILFYAELKETNFNGADLRNANLTNANIDSTFFWGTDLRDAILIGVDLSKANTDENTKFSSDVKTSEREKVTSEEKQKISIEDEAPSSQASDQQNSTSEGEGGCLIATAAFGSELSPQVQQLREIRDNVVLNTKSGRGFMNAFNQYYYIFSPAVADLERESPIFKESVKTLITPLLSSLSILNIVHIDSEEEMLGYGIGIILLNIGMYFVIPLVVVHRIKKVIN